MIRADAALLSAGAGALAAFRAAGIRDRWQILVATAELAPNRFTAWETKRRI